MAMPLESAIMEWIGLEKCPSGYDTPDERKHRGLIATQNLGPAIQLFHDIWQGAKVISVSNEYEFLWGIAHAAYTISEVKKDNELTAEMTDQFKNQRFDAEWEQRIISASTLEETERLSEIRITEQIERRKALKKITEYLRKNSHISPPDKGLVELVKIVDKSRSFEHDLKKTRQATLYVLTGHIYTADLSSEEEREEKYNEVGQYIMTNILEPDLRKHLRLYPKGISQELLTRIGLVGS